MTTIVTNRLEKIGSSPFLDLNSGINVITIDVFIIYLKLHSMDNYRNNDTGFNGGFNFEVQQIAQRIPQKVF